MSRDPNYTYTNQKFNDVSFTTPFKPTKLQKFKAFRLLFYDEWRATLGFQRQIHKHFKD